jgi:hypothetical protein
MSVPRVPVARNTVQMFRSKSSLREAGARLIVRRDMTFKDLVRELLVRHVSRRQAKAAG